MWEIPALTTNVDFGKVNKAYSGVWTIHSLPYKLLNKRKDVENSIHRITSSNPWEIFRC